MHTGRRQVLAFTTIVLPWHMHSELEQNALPFKAVISQPSWQPAHPALPTCVPACKRGRRASQAAQIRRATVCCIRALTHHLLGVPDGWRQSKCSHMHACTVADMGPRPPTQRLTDGGYMQPGRHHLTMQAIMIMMYRRTSDVVMKAEVDSCVRSAFLYPAGHCPSTVLTILHVPLRAHQHHQQHQNIVMPGCCARRMRMRSAPPPDDDMPAHIWVACAGLLTQLPMATSWMPLLIPAYHASTDSPGTQAHGCCVPPYPGTQHGSACQKGM